MALILTGFSAIFTGVNLVTTIYYLRAPGLTMFRMPIFTWNMLVTGILILIAFPVFTSALVLLWCDRHLGAHIFEVSGGGVPVLWQDLFWFFGHPEVYILALPFFGIVTDVIAVFSRKPIFGYRAWCSRRCRLLPCRPACGRTTCSRPVSCFFPSSASCPT